MLPFGCTSTNTPLFWMVYFNLLILIFIYLFIVDIIINTDYFYRIKIRNLVRTKYKLRTPRFLQGLLNMNTNNWKEVYTSLSFEYLSSGVSSHSSRTSLAFRPVNSVSKEARTQCGIREATSLRAWLKSVYKETRSTVRELKSMYTGMVQCNIEPSIKRMHYGTESTLSLIDSLSLVTSMTFTDMDCLVRRTRCTCTRCGLNHVCQFTVHRRIHV